MAQAKTTRKTAKKTTARKAAVKKTSAKSPTTGAGPEVTGIAPGASGPRPPGVFTTLTAFCSNAEDAEAGILNGDPEVLHQACPIGTHQAAYTRLDGNGKATHFPARLTLCSSDWHQRHPRCWICKAAGTDLDPGTGQCVEGEACAERAHIRLTTDPRFERYRQYHEAAEALTADRPKPERRPTEGRPTEGRCEHCGEPTKGGRFVAGHDAKLKGDLIRAGKEGDVEAVAEAMFRNWYKPGRYPDLEDAAHAIVQEHKTDVWLAARVADRLGES